MVCIFFSCKLVTDNDSTSRTVSAFRIASGDLSGWTEDNASGYVEFTKNNMNALVDGDAPKYVAQGMIEGFRQNLTSGKGSTLRVFVLDFGTDSLATAMVETKNKDISDPRSVPGFGDSSTVADLSGLNAVSVFTSFGKYYFELLFGGYPDQNEGLNTAALFLGYYQNKEQKLQ